MSYQLTWAEIKAKVEAAGVKDSDRVDPRPYYGSEDWVVKPADEQYRRDIGADWLLFICI